MNIESSVRIRACPSQRLLAVIADKWSALLLYVLAGRTVRYLQLHREIDGISQKMLTQTLQNLERHGLIYRRVFAVVPPRVEYSLTALGEGLVPKLISLCEWCEENAGTVEAAKFAYEDSLSARVKIQTDRPEIA